MQIDLEKLDLIRTRLNVSYSEALKALRDSDGDVASALAALDQTPQQEPDLWAETIQAASQIKHLIQEGGIKRLRIKFGDQLVSEMPVALTALGAIAVATLAVVLSKVAIEVDNETTSEEQK